jgi:anti-anti-sigma factor
VRFPAGSVYVAVDPVGPVTVLTAYGLVDSESAGELLNRLTQAVRQGGRRIVIDIENLAWTSTTGIHMLLAVHRAAAATGKAIALGAVPQDVVDALRETGSNRSLPCFRTVDAAVERLAGVLT